MALTYIHDTAAQAKSLHSASITAAGTVTSTAITGNLVGIKYAVVQAVFTYGSGGTAAKFYVQTSLDEGTTWTDVACFAFATTTATRVVHLDATGGTALVTPSDGSMTDNTVANGILGDRLRVKQITTGTYASTTIAINVVTKG